MRYSYFAAMALAILAIGGLLWVMKRGYVTNGDPAAKSSVEL